MYSSKSLIEQMNEKGHQFYLIQNADGKYIGFIAFSGKEGDYFIHKFYISTDKQAKGIGTAVFEQFKSFIGDIKTIR